MQPQRLLGQRHAEHRPRRRLLHQLPAQDDEPHRIFERQDIREAGGRKFAEAVADHRFRLHSPRHDKPGQRIFKHEHDRLNMLRLIQLKGCRFRVPGRVQDVLHLAGGNVAVQTEAAIHLRAEHRLVPVQVRSHIDVLRALPGEHEHDGAAPVLRGEGDNFPFIEAVSAFSRRQRLNRFLDRAAGQDAPIFEMPAAALQRVRDIREAELAMLLKIGAQIGRHRIQRSRRMGRQRQQLARPPRP